jgi:thiol-disulfide isomerase/thioredoxin
MRTTRPDQYPLRLFVLSLCVSLAMAGASAASGGAVGAQTPVQDPAAAGAQIAWPMANAAAPALSAAATQLLHLLDLRVNDDAVELGARLIREHTDDAALHALYVISLSDYRGLKQAMRLSEEYSVRWPNDAWVQVARGYVIRDRTRTDAALAAAARARQLAPENVDIARYVMSIHAAHLLHGQAVALADSFITSGRASPQLRAATASILTDMASYPGIRDTAAAPLAKRELEIALAETSPSISAYLLAAETARRERRADDALPLLERAVALSPHSNAVRLAYWRGLGARRDVPADEKQAAIRAAIDSFLEERQHAVGARFAVAEYYQTLRDTAQFDRVADLIQREHAGTWHAAQIAGVRARNEANAAYDAANSKADSAVVTRQLREALWAITSMPGASSGVLAGTYSQLFRILTQDSTTAADELLSVVERIEEHSSSPSASPRYSSLPEALAERGSRLDYAEQLARAAREHGEDNLEWVREYFTVAEYADMLDWETSSYHATLGWVLFHKGEIAEAKRELEAAHEALNIAPTPPYRLGRIAEAEGDIETAERWYATGRGRETWDRRSSEALERLYLASNESLDGFDAYLVAIDERDRERRLANIHADRIAEPEPLPEFEHDWMNGGRFSSELLQGKVAVINFWGVWCAPCVREAPDIQLFAEKFRDHPDVVFITVSSDNDPDVTRDFMAEKGYDFPVVLDGGLARVLNIFAWPTTLFVDRDGRIVFSARGASLRMVEEYTWRVEALLGGPVADAGALEPADLESAIAQVRSLYFGRDFHHAAAVGDAALERWPESSELVAWTVAALSRTRPTPAAQAIFSSASADAALERAEALAKARPDDVWGAIAFAHALTYHTDRRGEALTASLRPLELAPTLPEAVWLRGLVLDEHRRYEEVISLIEEKWPIVDRQWAELLTVQGNAHLAWRSVKGPELRARGLDILAQARELDSENVNAHYLAGDALLWDRRVDEAANLVARAAALSPGALDVASLHWRLIQASPSLDSAQKQALIRASANELVAQRGQYPSILRRIARDLGWMGLPAEAAALQDRVLAEFANTEEAEWVLSDQWEELHRRSYFDQVGDTLAHRAELSTMLWSFIERSHHYQPALLGNAYHTLFITEERDASVSSDTLLFLARGAVEHGRGRPSHASVATGLAERGVHLNVAREIARDGIDAVEEFVAQLIDFFPTPGIAADVLDRDLTRVYNAISHVELKVGDLVAARKAINRALALKSENSVVQLRAGAVAEAEGDWESAEFHYASGERLERLSPGDKPNRQALERMYTARHGSMEGYEVFVAGIEERHRARRRQQVADSRIAEPEVMPAIDLEWLTGGRIGANELEDRIVVINFWGVWCSPCVAEAPQIQQLHEKYRDDPGVVFITVDVYDDPDDVRTWMAENKYDFPVLLDDHFAASAGVRSYPTTWFVDRNGRIVFSYSGETAEVFEEFVWRIEMLQAEAAATAAGGPLLNSPRTKEHTP